MFCQIIDNRHLLPLNGNIDIIAVLKINAETTMLYSRNDIMTTVLTVNFSPLQEGSKNASKYYLTLLFLSTFFVKMRFTIFLFCVKCMLFNYPINKAKFKNIEISGKISVKFEIQT